MGRSDSHRKGRSSCLDKLRAEHRRFQQEIASIHSCKTSIHPHGKRSSSDFMVAKDSSQVSSPSLPHSSLIRRHSHGIIDEEWRERCENLPPSSIQKEQEAVAEQRETSSHGIIKEDDDPSVSRTGSSACVNIDVRVSPFDLRVSPSGCALAKTREVDREKGCIAAGDAFEANGKDSIRLTATTLFTANKGQIVVNSTGSSAFTNGKTLQSLCSIRRDDSSLQHTTTTTLQLEPSCPLDPSLGESQKIMHYSDKRVLNVPIESISAKNGPTSPIGSIESSHRQELQLQTRRLNSEADFVSKHKACGSRLSNQGHEQMLASTSVKTGIGTQKCHCILREPRIPTTSDKIIQVRQGKSDPIECIHDHSSAAQILHPQEAAGSSSYKMEQKSILPDEDRPESKALPCPSTGSDPAAIPSHQEEIEAATVSVDRKSKKGEQPFDRINSIMQLDLGLKNVKSRNRPKSTLSKRLADQIKHILETLDGSAPIIQMPTNTGRSLAENDLNHSSKLLEANCGNSVSRLGRITSVGMPRLRRQFTANGNSEETRSNDAEMYLQEVVAALAAKPRIEVFGQQKTEILEQDAGTIVPITIATSSSLCNASVSNVTSDLYGTFNSKTTAGMMIGSKTISAGERLQHEKGAVCMYENSSSKFQVPQSKICTVHPRVPAVEHHRNGTLQSHSQNQTLPVEAKRLSDKGEQTEVSANALWQQGDGLECKSSSVEPASPQNTIYGSDLLPAHLLHPGQTDSEHCIRSMAGKALVPQTSKVSKEGNLQSETNLIPTEPVARDTGKDHLGYNLSGASRMQALWRLASKVVPVTSTLKSTNPGELGSGPDSPHASDISNGDNFVCDKFLQDTRKKVQKFIRGCRALENAAVERAFQPSKAHSRTIEAKSAIASGTESHNQISKVKPNKGLQDSRAVAAENLAHDIQALISNKNASNVVSTPKSVKWSNLGDSVAAAAQVVCQFTKDTVPLSTGDKWKKLVAMQEARSAFAKSTVLNMVGGNFDYDRIYQELKELEEERIKIHQREKAQRRLMSLPNSVVGASTKLDTSNLYTAKGKKNQAYGSDRRLRNGAMFVSSKSGSSTKRRRSTQSPARETGNKVPRLGFRKVQLQESICNDQNVESAKSDAHSENHPETQKKFRVEGHVHHLKTFSDNVANSMVWNDESETLGIRINDIAALAQKDLLTNHRSYKKSVKFMERKEKVPAWVERMSVKCKPLQNHCDLDRKSSHERFHLGSNLRRRSVRPPGAIFRSGKPIDWMPHGMKIIKYEAQKRSEEGLRSLEGSPKFYYQVEDLEAKHEHRKYTKNSANRNAQLRKRDLSGKGTQFYVHKDKFEGTLDTDSPLHYQRSASIRKIHFDRMPSHFVEGKPAVSSDSESKLSKSSGSNMAEAPVDGLEHHQVPEARIAPPLNITGSDKPKYAVKVSQAVPFASICRIEGDGEKPRGLMIVEDFFTEGNGNIPLQKDAHTKSSDVAVAFLPEARTTSTVSNLSLETIAAERAPLSNRNNIFRLDPVSTHETMHHRGQPFDANAENGRSNIQNEEKASSITHVETKYFKQPSFGYRSRLEEEVLKRALLEVILHSMLNEDHQQSAIIDKQNQQGPSDSVAILKTKSRSLGSSQIQKDVHLVPLEAQNQEVFCSSTLLLSPLMDYKTDPEEPLVALPSPIDLSESLQTTISTHLTTCVSHHLHSEAHVGPNSSIGLTLLPWPMPMPQYVMADGRMTMTSQAHFCSSLPEPSVAFNLHGNQPAALSVPCNSTTIKQNPAVLNDNSISNTLNMVHKEVASGQERELAAFSKQEPKLDPAFVSSSAVTRLKCLADDVGIIASPMARRYRLGQTARPILRLEELQSCPYEISPNVNPLTNIHFQNFSQAVNEKDLEPERNQLVPNEENPNSQEAALGIVGFVATSCGNMPSSEHSFEEYGFKLKDKTDVERDQEHATVGSEILTIQPEQNKQPLGIGVMMQTQDFRRETASRNESSCAAEELIIEGCDYNDSLTFHRSYFQSIKWTKEEQLQLAAWSLIENFSLSDNSPEHLSGHSFHSDERFLSDGETDFKELGRVLFPLVSEDSTSSSSNKPSDSSTSSSKDLSSSAGTIKTKSDLVRCDLAAEIEGHLLSEGEFEPGTVRCNMEEVGQLHQQPYIEPGELKRKSLEGLSMPHFSQEEASGSISEGEFIPGCLGEKGEIWKKF